MEEYVSAPRGEEPGPGEQLADGESARQKPRVEDGGISRPMSELQVTKENAPSVEPEQHSEYTRVPDTGKCEQVAMETKEPKDDGKEGDDSTRHKREKKGKNSQNPFMPRRVNPQKPESQRENHAEPSEQTQKSSDTEKPPFTNLTGTQGPEGSDEDTEGLMEWWSTVEHWDDVPTKENLSEKEETKALIVTADKVNKGIRIFNKLFTDRAEDLWQHVVNLFTIADGIDRVNKRTKIASITGGSTSAVGGVATIAGLALAPVTMGTSLIVTAVGLGVATAGGLTSASAGISSTVSNSMDRKKVEKIVEDYQAKMADISKCVKFIRQGVENLRRFNVLKLRSKGYSQNFPDLDNLFSDGVMAGKSIVSNTAEIMRVVQIANVAGSTAARAVQIASLATGVLTGLFVGMDIYFVAKDSRELKKGAKSEFAAKIREVATQLSDGLVELNVIHHELQGIGGNQ